jgi:hypothetical protein
MQQLRWEQRSNGGEQGQTLIEFIIKDPNTDTDGEGQTETESSGDGHGRKIRTHAHVNISDIGQDKINVSAKSNGPSDVTVDTENVDRIRRSVRSVVNRNVEEGIWE